MNNPFRPPLKPEIVRELHLPLETLKNGKKLYFISDLHLGAPNWKESLDREKRVLDWLDEIQKSAHSIFFLGDVFDFWVEYRKVIPKGFVRFLGRLATLADRGIHLHFFHGNHDMWMNGYLEKELNAQVYPNLLKIQFGDLKILTGHGDGFGPGDPKYKFLKKVFRNRYCQALFKTIHPDIGIWIAQTWSGNSRSHNIKNGGEVFYGEGEMLWQFCKDVEESTHHDYYLFGHRHLRLELEVGTEAQYFNLGEWINGSAYACFDGEKIKLLDFQ